MMHCALFLEEILYFIFGHCYPERHFESQWERTHYPSDLIALASTCRAFKEPALDVLWAELRNTTPLVRCLPEVCVTQQSESGRLTYSFKRRLEETERETVRSYTRRVRSLTIIDTYCVDLASLEDLCLPATTNALFPNIRKLYFNVANQTLPLIHHIVSPMLTTLQLDFMLSDIDISSCEDLVRSLGPNCPCMKSIRITSLSTMTMLPLNKTTTRSICLWTHLQEVDFSGIYLDVDSLLHLSRIHDLTVLSFMLSPALTDQIVSFSQPLVFATLQRLQIKIGSLVPVSKLFQHVQLPAIMSVSTTFFNTSPSRQTIRSILVTLQSACPGNRGLRLSICHFASLHFNAQDSERPTLTLEDIQHSSALNLTSIYIDLDWVVDLKDSDLLEIASMCQQLTTFEINNYHGWRSAGITPSGLAQFLWRCPSLLYLSVAVDTRGYIHSQTRRNDEDPMPCLVNVDFLDSLIEADTVPEMAAFFADHFPRLVRGSFFLKSWASFIIRRHREDWEVHKRRWEDVRTLAKQLLLEHPRRTRDVSSESSSESSGCAIT